MAGHPEEFLCVPHELYDVVVATIRMVVSFVASVTWKSSLNTYYSLNVMCLVLFLF
jgi:hypothetical protein